MRLRLSVSGSQNCTISHLIHEEPHPRYALEDVLEATSQHAVVYSPSLLVYIVWDVQPRLRVHSRIRYLLEMSKVSLTCFKAYHYLSKVQAR